MIEKAAGNYEAAENHTEKFANIVPDKNLGPEQMYFAGKIAQHWD